MQTIRKKQKTVQPRRATRSKAARCGPAGGCPPLDEVLDPRLFKALADPSRLAVLLCLTRACGPRTVTQVAECCAVDMSVVSRHLAILRDAGVLEVDKQGRQTFYTVRYDALCQSLRDLADALEACCGGPAR